MDDLAKRVGEIDDLARENAKKLDEIKAELEDVFAGMEGIKNAVKQLGTGMLTSQIMEETITRYMAGYEVGDYTKEIEMATNENVKAPSDFKIFIKNADFNQERFNGLAEEIGQVIVNMRTQQVQKRLAEMAEGKSPLLGADGRPAGAAPPKLSIVPPLKKN